MERYNLLHKNNIVAELTFNIENGNLESVNAVYDQKLLPLSCQNDAGFLKSWWAQRAVSKSQSNIREVLRQNNIVSLHSFLLSNLGLSMTDSYWVRPLDSKIGWEEVSFHLNPFSSDALDFFSGGKSSNASNSIHALYTPSASSGGELKKKWIKKNGKIFLTKGNMPGFSYQQSLNEVFASSLHRMQDYKNYVDYKLLRFDDDSVGCISECFTSEDIEFIPAWELFQKYGNGTSSSLIQRYIDIAVEEGYSKKEITDFISYQTITDFLLTNIDRHLNNFGILRDSNTLEPISPAPIFDTGNSMFYLGIGIMSYKDLFCWNISSLYPNEKEMMIHLDNYSLLDIDKIPTREAVESFYSKDPAIAHYSGIIANYYEFKRNIIENLQKGVSYNQIERDVISFFGDIKERNNINSCWETVSDKYNKANSV